MSAVTTWIVSAALCAAADDAPILLQPNWTPGTVAVYRFAVGHTVTSSEDVRQVVHMELAHTFALRVTSVTSDNETVLSATLRRVEWSASNDKDAQQFDTDQTPSPGEAKEFAPFRKALGQTYMVTLSADGEILRLRGGSFLLDKPASLAEMMGESPLTTGLRSLHGWAPGEPVAVGARWQKRDQTLVADDTRVDRLSHLTFVKRSSGRATVRSVFTLTPAPIGKPNNARTPQADLPLSAKPGSAEVIVREGDGLVESIQSEVELQLTGAKAGRFFRKKATSVTLRAKLDVRLLPKNSALQAN